MSTKINATPRWSTASSDREATTSPMELSAVGNHLHRRKGSRGRRFALQSFADRFNGFVAARFMSTLAVVALLIALIGVGVLML